MTTERKEMRRDMEYTIYQLEFKTGVHFGTGMLNESACTFKADQIFSALYIAPAH